MHKISKRSARRRGLRLSLAGLGLFSILSAFFTLTSVTPTWAGSCTTYPLGPGHSDPIIVISGCAQLIGAGENTTFIDGAAGFGLEVLSGATVYLSDLTITGNATSTTNGAAIENSGTLTLNHVLVTGNPSSGTSGAGAIANMGIMTIENSSISRNSDSGISGTGGIWNASGSTLTIESSTISQNTSTGPLTGGFAGDVGGIRNDGTLDIYQSTITGNSAPNDGNGGGIFSDGTLYISGSTINGNTAGAEGGGGGLYNEGTATILGGLISYNAADVGGGIYNSTTGSLALKGTGAIDYNSASLGAGIYNDGFLPSLSGFTLQGNT